MKILFFTLSLCFLSGCTFTREARVSEVSPVSGVVRLTYNQLPLQNARTDTCVTHATAARECRRLGYADALAFGLPVATCSLYAGPLCLNHQITLAWQCRSAKTTPC
ncbi:YecR family lipoprotein [Intestinirhabdus alba]|uniref:Lipoprotein n=1 Tax=Intestinirhabdus alba TaxID=2899544 RepID=A0A6L6IKV6_9ENTR|nr:YecR family lipoprotein [Intestinirhabdus alba]MTH46517.1 hypothetical protein [Intestinirhabdus alba]